jgi:hypothetical protein
MPPFQDRSVEINRQRKELREEAKKLFEQRKGILAGIKVERASIEPLVVRILEDLSARTTLGDAIFIGLKNELITELVTELSTDKNTGMEKYEPIIEVTRSAPIPEAQKTNTDSTLTAGVKNISPEELEEIRKRRFDLQDDED